MEQASLFAPAPAGETPAEAPDLASYDRYLCCFSGGKDSVACLLTLLEAGVPREKIELHHHCVDGNEGSTLMDWPVTEDYCRRFAEAFDLPIYFSWKQGGFEREMLRSEAPTAPITFETPEGDLITSGGVRGTLGTRLKFPQVAADLRTRWCSAYLKVDVFDRLITQQARFQTGRTLVVTGERAQESSARARYRTFEPHRADRRDGKRVQRHIDHWRPVHQLGEREVWALLEKYAINPHPAYWCGWGRTSCMACIFGSANQWATIRRYAPERFEAIAAYEEAFGCTIQRTCSVRELAERGTPYDIDPEMLELALSETYSAEVISTGTWRLPPGAFGECNGPT